MGPKRPLPTTSHRATAPHMLIMPGSLAKCRPGLYPASALADSADPSLQPTVTSIPV
jgi:hypothetical protein